MRTREAHDRSRRRQRARLKVLRGRVVLGSALGFTALVGLAGHHAASAKHRTAVVHAGRAALPPARFFDEADSSFAFDGSAARDAKAAQAEQPQSTAEPSSVSPPVAVTSVS